MWLSLQLQMQRWTFICLRVHVSSHRGVHTRVYTDVCLSVCLSRAVRLLYTQEIERERFRPWELAMSKKETAEERKREAWKSHICAASLCLRIFEEVFFLFNSLSTCLSSSYTLLLYLRSTQVPRESRRLLPGNGAFNSTAACRDLSLYVPVLRSSDCFPRSLRDSSIPRPVGVRHAATSRTCVGVCVLYVSGHTRELSLRVFVW